MKQCDSLCVTTALISSYLYCMYQFVRKWKARGELLTTRQVLTLRFSVVPKGLVEQSFERWNCLLSYLSTRSISLDRLLCRDKCLL